MRHGFRNRSMIATELALGFAVGAIMALTGPEVESWRFQCSCSACNRMSARPTGRSDGQACGHGAAAALPAGTVRHRAAILMSVSGMLPYRWAYAFAPDRQPLARHPVLSCCFYCIPHFLLCQKTFPIQCARHRWTNTRACLPSKHP